MADNSTQQGNDTIATDDITTLNGGAVSGVKAQRMKVGFGSDASFRDVDLNNGLPIGGSQSAASSTAWTSATANNTANSISVSGMNTVSVAIVTTTTITAGTVNFEVSPDGTNWFPVAMARIDSYNVESTYALVASTSRAWSTSVDGFTNFRVRLSPAITGTGTATVLVTAQTMPVEPIASVGQAVASNLNATVVGTATATSTGLLVAKILSAATTNSTLVLTGVRTVYGWHLMNTSAAVKYVRFFNKATAPTSGTDSPLFVIALPAGGGAVLTPGDQNIGFSLGLGYTITGAAADLDNTAVAANDVVGTIWYK